MSCHSLEGNMLLSPEGMKCVTYEELKKELRRVAKHKYAVVDYMTQLREEIQRRYEQDSRPRK
jgi:hypothetical protein